MSDRTIDRIIRRLWFIGALVAAFMIYLGVLAWFLSSATRAEMAPNFPARDHPWLHGLYSPPREGWPSGEHCCTDADCWLITYRIRSDVPEGMSGYQVWFHDEWLNVPADRVLRRNDNPTGNAVLCIQASTLHIFCFVPGGEG